MTSLSFVAHYQTRPNLHSFPVFHSGTENQPLIMKQKNEKIGTKASQSTCLDINLLHLCFCLVCQLLLCGVLATHQIL